MTRAADAMRHTAYTAIWPGCLLEVCMMRGMRAGLATRIYVRCIAYLGGIDAL